MRAGFMLVIGWVTGHLTALWAGAPFGMVFEYFLGWRSVFAAMAIAGAVLAASIIKRGDPFPE